MEEDIEAFVGMVKPVSAMSFRELKDYIAQLRAAGFEVRKYLSNSTRRCLSRSSIWSRCSSPSHWRSSHREAGDYSE
jgi:hypothetical protein